VLGALRDVVDCHCHRCRRFTGHYMAATSAELDDVRIDDPQSLLRWFHPVEEAAYAFCSGCGSSLFWRSDASPTRLSICAGALDPPTGLTTTQAWWVAEASDYYVPPHLPELPGE
jgi:hypothetical protein